MNPVPAPLALRRIRRTIFLAVLAGGLFSSGANALARSERPEGLIADAFRDKFQSPAKDLLLGPAEERKAAAMAAFVAGFIAESNADADRALTHYRKALSLDPGYAELAIKVAYELAQRGEVSDGIGLLKDAIHENPHEPDSYLVLAQLYARYLKKFDVAIRYGNQALELDAANFASYLTLFELHTANGDPKKGLQILDRAAKSTSDDPQFWQQLGETLARLALKEGSAPSKAELRKMNAIFERAVKLADDDPILLGKIADYYVLSRQVKEAVPLYLKVIELKKLSGDETLLANTRDKLARSLFVTGQHDLAIEVLGQLVLANPLRYESYEMLGQLYEEKGDFERALQNYQKSLLLDPTQPLNYLRVSDMLMKLKKPGDAVTTLTTAKERFPSLPPITYSLAVVLSQAGRHAEAMTKFEEALQEAQDGREAMINAAFYFSYGAAAEQAGLLDKATELFRKSISLDPANAAEAYNYLGFMWVDRGENLEEAGQMIEKAVASDPQNGAYLDSLGWYFFKVGNYEKALAELLRASQIVQPPDAVIFDHLGDTYARLGRTVEALAAWQKANELKPDQKIAGKIEGAKQQVTAIPGPKTAPAH